VSRQPVNKGRNRNWPSRRRQLIRYDIDRSCVVEQLYRVEFDSAAFTARRAVDV